MSRARRSDGEATRLRILEAAGELIAQRGYAQTSNKAVAQAADVDMATINYHFGGRQGLYLAVLSEAHRHFLDGSALKSLAESQQEPVEKLNTFIDMLVTKTQGIPGWYNQVLFRELFSPSVELTDFIESEGMLKFASIRKIIGGAAGLPEEDPRVLLCTLNVIAPCLMLIVAGKRVPGPASAIGKVDSQILASHFKDFALAGLRIYREG